MRITYAKIVGANQRLTKTIAERGEFATAQYSLTGRSLHMISHCPSGWFRRGSEEDKHTSAVAEAVWALLVMPARATTVLAVRPEKHMRLALVCPKCQSVSSAKHCMQCDLDRRPKDVEVNWTRQIPACRAWEERAVATGRVLISTPDFGRAQAAVEAATAPPSIRAMLADSERGVVVRGDLVADDGKSLSVIEPVLAIPPESAPDGDSIYLLMTVATSAPGVSDNLLEWRGAATRGALALDLVNRATDGVRKRVRFVLAGLGADAEPGYCELSQASLQAGRRTYEAGAAHFLTGCQTKVWPGHDHDGQGNVAWRVLDPQHLSR